MMDNTKMTLGSLFDGSGGFPLGGILAGIEPKWSSEIEPFPVLVTHKRLPGVKHYGDVSRLSGAELPPVDIITFGSPCQDLSIAGKRAGIHDGDRSNLFFQAIRIIKEMRDATNGRYPRYCVWENVPGAFSSHGGDDFKAVLEAVIGIKEEGIEVPSPENHRWPKSDVYLGDGWSVAYRVFDAQYWGVPQRRARIYLVADLAGGSAGEVLFKSEGVSGYTPQGFRAWQGAAGGAEEGAGETGGRSDTGGGTLCVNCQGTSGVGITEDKALALVAQDHGNHPAVLAAGFSTEHSAKARSIGYEEEVSPTLRAGVVPAALSVENHPTDGRVKIREDDTCQTLCSRAGTGGNNVPLVAEPVTLKIRSGCEGGRKGRTLAEGYVRDTRNTQRSDAFSAGSQSFRCMQQAFQCDDVG
jgi:DNA (cytosine-5)-methyltransferase 1